MYVSTSCQVNLTAQGYLYTVGYRFATIHFFTTLVELEPSTVATQPSFLYLVRF